MTWAMVSLSRLDSKSGKVFFQNVHHLLFQNILRNCKLLGYDILAFMCILGGGSTSGLRRPLWSIHDFTQNGIKSNGLRGTRNMLWKLVVVWIIVVGFRNHIKLSIINYVISLVILVVIAPISIIMMSLCFIFVPVWGEISALI